MGPEEEGVAFLMLYDYKCRKCSELFEEYIKNLKEEKDIKCPKCGAKRPERLPVVIAHQTHVMGKTLADGRVRDKMKRSNFRPKSAALFDDGRRVIG